MIDVSNALKNPGQVYPLVCRITIAEMEVLDDPVSFENVELQGEMVGADDSVGVKGTITGIVHSRCAKCLSPVSQTISADVDEVFARHAEGDSSDVYPLDGYQLDPTPLVTDALILALPMRFLCKEDCLGLCPVCGKNRNENPCACLEGGKVANPFAALSNLLNVDHNEEV